MPGKHPVEKCSALFADVGDSRSVMGQSGGGPLNSWRIILEMEAACAKRSRRLRDCLTSSCDCLRPRVAMTFTSRFSASVKARAIGCDRERVVLKVTCRARPKRARGKKWA